MVALAAWTSRGYRLNSDMYLHRLESGSGTSPHGRRTDQQATANKKRPILKERLTAKTVACCPTVLLGQGTAGRRKKKRTDDMSEQDVPSVRMFVSSEQTRAAALAISKSNRCTNNQERQGRRLGRGDRVDDHIIELLFR